MVKVSLKMQDVYFWFVVEYNRLYDCCNDVPNFEHAVSFGNELIRNHSDFATDFAQYRGHALNSDMEVAALMFALSHVMKNMGTI